MSAQPIRQVHHNYTRGALVDLIGEYEEEVDRLRNPKGVEDINQMWRRCVTSSTRSDLTFTVDEVQPIIARLAEAEELLRDCRDLNTTGLRRRIERFLDREERYGSPKRTVTNRSGFPETGTEPDGE